MSCNIMKEYVDFSRKCIKNYIKLIMDKQFEQEVFDELVNVYIDVRYHNLYEKKYKKFQNNISYHLLQETYKLLEQDDKSEKEKDNIKKTFSLFEYILYFDNVMDCDSAKEIIKKIQDTRINKLNIKDDDFPSTFFEVLKKDLNKKKEFLNKLETKDFNIVYSKTNQDYVYDTYLEHNLKFPKIYSKYAIDKAFVSKEISEQKLFVIYPSIVGKVLKDVLKGDFKKNYLVDYVASINDKPRKSKRLLSMFDDDISKEKIIMKISYKDFIKYKDQFYQYMRAGYRFAIILDETFILNAQNLEILQVFKYIIVNKNYIYFKEFKDLANTIVSR